MNEVWVTVDEAMQLTQLCRTSIYRKMRTFWVTRPAWRTSGNGLNPREIALYSLPPAAQALYWMGRRSLSLCALLDSDLPGMSYSDIRETSAGHHG